MHVLCDISMLLIHFHTPFEHIWTNLLTQCTQLPVPVFCYFCISGFPAIKSAPKIPEKLYKKSAPRKLPESPRKRGGPPQGLQKGPWRGPALGRARHPPGCPVAPLVPPFGPIFTPAEETLILEPFFPEAIPISAAISIKFRGTRILVPAPCRDGEVPPDLSPSPLLPSSIKRE